MKYDRIKNIRPPGKNLCLVLLYIEFRVRQTSRNRHLDWACFFSAQVGPVGYTWLYLVPTYVYDGNNESQILLQKQYMMNSIPKILLKLENNLKL